MQLKIDIKNQVKRTSALSKKGFFGNLIGEYKSAFRGRGLEFTGFRNYDTNDDAIRIDWKASLRSKELLVRKFEEERNLNVVFLFDTSNSMLYSSVNKIKAEYAAELIGALSFGIIQAEDSVGLIMFNSKVKKYIAPQFGKEQFFNITTELLNMQNYAGKKDYKKAMQFVISALPKTSIIFLVTDFIGLPSDYESLLKNFGNRFELVCLMIRDPNDNDVPDIGKVTISDPFSDKEIIVDTTYLRFYYSDYVKKFKNNLNNVLNKVSADLVEFETDKDFVDILLKFFSKRKRKKEIRKLK